MKQAQQSRGKHKQWNVNVENNTNHKFNRKIVQTTKKNLNEKIQRNVNSKNKTWTTQKKKERKT
jgi:hypothetical protein